MKAMERKTARVIRGSAQVKSIPVLVGMKDPAADQEPSPTAELLRDEEGAMRIEVTCSCGRKIVIECDVEEP